MDFQPYLTDGVVTLRPLRGEDWEALYGIASDPELWALHPARDRWQESVFRAFFDAGLASGSALVAEDAGTGMVIGSSRYSAGDAGEGEVEIGWTFLSRDRWGSGANAAMKRLMLAHALTHFERVIFLIGEDNIRSRRAIEKIGGELTERRLTRAMTGGRVDHVVYAIDRADFASGPLSSPLV